MRQNRKLPDGSIDRNQVNKDGQYIMSRVAALFVRVVDGHVETAVCGARRDRVFYGTELPGMCERGKLPFAYSKEILGLVKALCTNKDIKTINGVDIGHFRKHYDKKDYEKVYRLICRTELHHRLRFARDTGNVAAYEDYLDRKELYDYDQTLLGKRPWPPEAQRRAKRERVISNFKASLVAPKRPTPSSGKAFVATP